MTMFVAIIGAILLSLACNLDARPAAPDYGQMVTPEMVRLYAAMKQAILTEKPDVQPEVYEAHELGDVVEGVHYDSLMSHYTEGDLYKKLHYLDVDNDSYFSGLRDRVASSAMNYFAANYQGRDKGEPEQIVKSTCDSLSNIISTNQLQTTRKSMDPYYHDHVGLDLNLLTLINLEPFCSILQRSNWGKQ